MKGGNRVHPRQVWALLSREVCDSEDAAQHTPLCRWGRWLRTISCTWPFEQFPLH